VLAPRRRPMLQSAIASCGDRPMPTPRLPRRTVSATLAVSAALFAAGARPPPGSSVQAGPPPQVDLLAGQFLVAAPEMRDPRFFHTVILMVQHDPRGALGIVINRPVGERPLAALLEALGDSGSHVAGEVQVFAGGPVEPGVGFVVHSAEYTRSGTISVDGRVAVTSSLEVLRDLGQGRGPQKSLVAFGYAGWRAGQLEDELAQGAWFTEPEDPGLVFDEDRVKVWDEAMKKRTYPL
jgi:putative transcriptional regulator